MGTVGPITPPFPSNDPTDSTDQTPASTYSPQQDLDDRLNWAKNHAADLGQLISALEDGAQSNPKAAAWAAKGIGWVLHGILEWVLEWETTYLDTVAKVIEEILPEAQTAQGAIFGYLFPVLNELLTEAASQNVSFGTGALAEVSQVIYQAVVEPFSLVGNAMDPTQVGSGIANQQYLLSQALGLAVAEWFIDSVSQYTGAGVLRTFWPMINLITQAVNPYNAVRMAMEYSYRFFIQQPLTRDMNRAYPIKDLGLSALAKLFIRGEIQADEYLSRCLDSGLNNQWADQLIYETQKLLAPGDVSTLLTHGILSEDQARTRLLQQGYVPGDASLRIYLDQHARYFSIQERVGNEAVDAWKKKYIDQAQLEQILGQTGFTQEEIQLLEIEGQLTKPWNATKELSYSQVKDLYKENIMGIEDVISFLQQPDSSGKTYAAADITRLVLLDFTEAAQRQARAADLAARLRVESDTAAIQAQEAQNKNEQDLASAKANLAKVLGESASLLGELQTLPGVSALLG